jgi:hypothetical protein
MISKLIEEHFIYIYQYVSGHGENFWICKKLISFHCNCIGFVCTVKPLRKEMQETHILECLCGRFETDVESAFLLQFVIN